MINKNAQFNREKVPERVVHARGMTAKGFFEVSAATWGVPWLPCGADSMLAAAMCSFRRLWSVQPAATYAVPEMLTSTVS